MTTDIQPAPLRKTTMATSPQTLFTHVRSPRSTRWAAILVTLPLLVGCTASEVPTATAWPVPSAGSDAGGRVAVEYPMPDFGPSPTPTPPPEAEREVGRLEAQDRSWQALTMSYPDAVRPSVGFNEYREDEVSTAAFAECLKTAGIALDYGRGTDENVPGIGWSTNTEEQAIAAFVCESERPDPPLMPSDEILGYNYDYLTEFIVPCYEANGQANPPAPSRDEFIATWPNQNWFPIGPWDANWAEGHSIDDVCPLLP